METPPFHRLIGIEKYVCFVSVCVWVLAAAVVAVAATVYMTTKGQGMRKDEYEAENKDKTTKNILKNKNKIKYWIFI